MAIKVGDRIPDVELRTMGPDGPQPVRTGDVLGTGKVVLFAVPGAFTPGCSKIHLPGYVEHGAELKAKGVSTIACVAVNDAWVMQAWAEAQGAEGITMLADGNGEFA
ncbi:MAG: peroxiredoxin, partial [Actinomycetota bacterium]|nr:peroxiredoxin [Actinomycetota bacterium]